MAIEDAFEGTTAGSRHVASRLNEQYVQEMGPRGTKTLGAKMPDSRKPQLESDKPAERSSVSSPESKKILDVLNGTDGHGRMNVHPSTKQLVVVTSDEFKKQEP